MSNDIPPAVFKFVEHELYNYNDTKEALEDLKEDIAKGSIGNMTYDNFSSTETYPEGSTTEAAFSEIIQNKVAKRMSNTIKYIDRALNKLDEQKLRLYYLKYRKEKSWQSIVATMDISQATFFRWRKDIVKIVAREMGLLQ